MFPLERLCCRQRAPNHDAAEASRAVLPPDFVTSDDEATSLASVSLPPDFGYDETTDYERMHTPPADGTLPRPEPQIAASK